MQTPHTSGYIGTDVAGIILYGVNRVIRSLVAAEPELVKDDRLPASGFDRGGAVKYVLSHSGVRGFLRGALPTAAITGVSIMAHCVGCCYLPADPMTGTCGFGRRLARAALGAVLLWPLRALYNNVVAANYLTDIVAITRDEVMDMDAPQEQVKYRHESLAVVFSKVRARMGWRGIMFYGSSVYVAKAALAFAVKEFSAAAHAHATASYERKDVATVVAVVSVATGLLHVVLLCPLQNVAVRATMMPPHSRYETPLEASGRRYPGAVACAKAIWQAEGAAGLFRGLLQDVVFNMVLPAVEIAVAARTFIPMDTKLL